MVVITTDVARHRDDLGEIQVPARVRWCAEAVPGCTPITTDVATRDPLLEQRERATKDRTESRRLNRVELLLRIVQVVDVERSDAKVLLASFNLMCQERRRERVTASYEIIGTDDSGVDVRRLQIRQIRLTTHRRGAVQRDVTTFRADDDFIARHHRCGDRVAQCRAHGALRPLAPIVDRRVDDVDTLLEGRSDRTRVPRVIRLVALAEVGPDTEGRSSEGARERPKEVFDEPAFVPVAIPLSPVRRGSLSGVAGSGAP